MTLRRMTWSKNGLLWILKVALVAQLGYASTTPTSAEPQRDSPLSSSGFLAPLGSTAKLRFLDDVFRNGLPKDPTSHLTSLFTGRALELISENVEIQHRILEATPMLAAIPGFREARGRRLNDQDTKAAFLLGVKNLLAHGRDAITKAKDPASMQRAINELAASNDPDVQATLEAARGGDEAAAAAAAAAALLQDLLASRVFPGVDLSVVREVMAAKNFDKVLQSPDIMHFIDQDAHMSRAFREGLVLPSTRVKAAGAL